MDKFDEKAREIYLSGAPIAGFAQALRDVAREAREEDAGIALKHIHCFKECCTDVANGIAEEIRAAKETDVTIK